MDSETKISQENGLNWRGTLQVARQSLWRPEVFWGTGISLLLNFSGMGPDAWVQLIAAEINFFDVSKFPLLQCQEKMD